MTLETPRLGNYLESGSIFLSEENEFPSSSGAHLWPTMGLSFCAENK